MDTVHPLGSFGTPAVRIDNTKIYGPGVTDCKGGVVAAALTMDALSRCGYTARPIMLILQSDEENGSKLSNKATINYICERAKDVIAFLNLEGHTVGSLAGEPRNVITPEEKAQALKDGFAKFGGESNEEFHKRICEFLALLEKSEHQNIAVFTYAGFMRGLLDVVLVTYISRENIRCDNCVIGVFEYNNSKWLLDSWVNTQ